MVAGVHFLPDDPPDLIGRKLLRVNLSDLAAKGAVPLGYLMTVAAPRGTSDAFFATFASGLAADQAAFGIELLGGDTVATPGPLTLSLTALGHVAPDVMPRRAGAHAGDVLWVTGTIGDGALGLLVAQGTLSDPSGYLLGRYRLPRPRLGIALGGIVSAAMDVSDGLVQDLGNICRARGIAAEVEAAAVPLSDPARAAGPAWLPTCLTGGDDYELLIAAAPEREAALRAACAAVSVPVTRIGRFHPGPPGVIVRGPGGEALSLGAGGWSHF
jgi:thiamine-monophosphate kinase